MLLSRTQLRSCADRSIRSLQRLAHNVSCQWESYPHKAEEAAWVLDAKHQHSKKHSCLKVNYNYIGASNWEHGQLLKIYHNDDAALLPADAAWPALTASRAWQGWCWKLNKCSLTHLQLVVMCLGLTQTCSSEHCSNRVRIHVSDFVTSKEKKIQPLHSVSRWSRSTGFGAGI